MNVPASALPSKVRLRGLALLVVCGLVLTSCQSNIQLGRDKPADNSSSAEPYGLKRQQEEKSSGEGAGGIFSALIHGFGTEIDPNVNPPAFYRHNFQLWESDHRALSRAAGRNDKGVTEIIRQVVGSLSGMKEMLDDEGLRDELTQAQLRYESIAEKALDGFSPTSFTLALDKLKWRIEKKFKPGSKGLTYRPASYFRQLEEREFQEQEEF